MVLLLGTRYKRGNRTRNITGRQRGMKSEVDNDKDNEVENDVQIGKTKECPTLEDLGLPTVCPIMVSLPIGLQWGPC